MVYTRNYEKEFVKELDKKEHGLKGFYPLSLFLILETPLRKYMQKQGKQLEILSLLHVSEDKELVQILYWCKKLSMCFLMISLFTGISFATEIGKSGTNLLKENGYFLRQEKGQGEEYVDIEVSASEQEKQIISVTIPERTYTQEEAKTALQEAKEYVKEHYLGENESNEMVIKDLNLMERIPNSFIAISWQILDGSCLSYDGKIDFMAIPKEGEIVNLMATLSYEEQEEELGFRVHIYPKTEFTEKEWREAVQTAIEEAGKENPSEEKYTLPAVVLDREVSYTENVESNAMFFLGIGLVTIVVIWIFYDKDLKDKRKKHDEQMWMDYPDLVNKFTLLLGAGMTVGGAWEKIACVYLQKKKKGKINTRYAYEEWCMTWYEMQNGVTEVSALEHFGKRIQLLPYLKFGSLLSQNLKKGSKGLLELLEYEALDAFEERKQMTKRLAEEASTKLLAPMMVMLGLVMVIIMVPAMMAL